MLAYFVLHEQLRERDDDHQQNTRPEHPEARTGSNLVRRSQTQGAKGHVLAPVWVIRGKLLAECHFVVHEGGADNTPSKHRSTEEREGRVESNEHTDTNESGSPLNHPAPVLDVDCHVVVVTYGDF